MDYGHDDAMRDLEAIYPTRGVTMYADHPLVRLAAYIERLELAYKNCRDCEIFTGNTVAQLRAERDEALRELAEA